MDRRQFCKTSIAAGVAAAYPFLGACGERPQTAADAVTSIPAISLDGAEIELEKAAIHELGEALEGPVLLSDSPGYDTARAIWNGMHDKRPALIAQPAAPRTTYPRPSLLRATTTCCWRFAAAVTAGRASPFVTADS